MKAPTQTRKDVFEEKDGVAYADLLTRAHDNGLKSISTELLLQPSETNGRLCIIKAAVETDKGHFEGIGDADPTSVEEQFSPHLIRVAETRAKARALRDAVNVGIVSFEELDGVRRPAWGDVPGSGASVPPARRPAPRRNGPSSRTAAPRGNGGGNGQDGLMTEAQRRYLFRLLAGMGYQGKAAEEYLHAELEVRNLNQVTRAQASGLIDQLLQSSPQGEGGGTPGHQR
jgi:hypothetical protein